MAVAPLYTLPAVYAEALAERPALYQFFSRLFFTELSEEALAKLAAGAFPVEAENPSLARGAALVQRYFALARGDVRTQLACEYARVFLAAGVYTQTRAVAVPYESVFTSEEHLVAQDARDKVLSWYRCYGFAVASNLHEPEDHLAFELEFLAHLAERTVQLVGCVAEGTAEGTTEGTTEGGEGSLTMAPCCSSQGKASHDRLLLLLKDQVAFTRQHVLNWLPALLQTAEDYAQTTFYTGMLLLLQGYLQDDVALCNELAATLASAKG